MCKQEEYTKCSVIRRCGGVDNQNIDYYYAKFYDLIWIDEIQSYTPVRRKEE